LLTVSKGRLSTRLLAIYLVNSEWIVFDGEREDRISNVVATWEEGPSLLGGLGIASLSLQIAGSQETITYFRPWLRHWFESGWSLNDVDIAWVVPHLIADEAARARLRQALDVEQHTRVRV
jgi:hypothetical protein